MRSFLLASCGATGAQILANVCAYTKYRSVVAACGFAIGMALPPTVTPLVLPGVACVGIGSMSCAKHEQFQAWRRLAQVLDPSLLEGLTESTACGDIIPAAEKLIAGAIRGRGIVPIS